MYWPVGSASTVSVSSTATERPTGSAECLVGLGAIDGAQGRFFLTVAGRAVTVWHGAWPRVALAKVVVCLANGRLLFARGSGGVVGVVTDSGRLLVYGLAVERSSGCSGSQYGLSTGSNDDQSHSSPPLLGLPKVSLCHLATIGGLWSVGDLAISSSHLLLYSNFPPSLRHVPLAGLANSCHDAPIPVSNLAGLIHSNVSIIHILLLVPPDIHLIVASDGSAYLLPALALASPAPTCFLLHNPRSPPCPLPARGVSAFNPRFSLIAIGLQTGLVAIYQVHLLPPLGPASVHDFFLLDLNAALLDTHLSLSDVVACSWSSDGHALAVAYEAGYSIWSVYGKLLTWSHAPLRSDSPSGIQFQDRFMCSGHSLVWGPGNFHLFLLTQPSTPASSLTSDDQLYVLHFAKSAVASLHSPDNTKHGLLQLEDRVLIYRPSGSPNDLSLINPESDLWEQVKIPVEYLSINYPISYACISDDCKLLAVSGSKGLTHFNAVSGRWKLFERLEEEQSFSVSGGMQWFGNILVVGVLEAGADFIRLFSRDKPLSVAYCLGEVPIPEPIVLLSILQNSILTLTSSGTLHHHHISEGFQVINCRSIAFCQTLSRACLDGGPGSSDLLPIMPDQVRGFSWFLDNDQLQFGDPLQDLFLARWIILLRGRLILLSPTHTQIPLASQSGLAPRDLSYNVTMLKDHVEFYWVNHQDVVTVEAGMEDHRFPEWCHLPSCSDKPLVHHLYTRPQSEDDGGRRALNDSVWVWDGRKLSMMWLASTPPLAPLSAGGSTPYTQLKIPLNFYPLSVLVEKGIIVGVESESLLKRGCAFVLFKLRTKTQLFIDQVIRFYLDHHQLQESIRFSKSYSGLVYFRHSLEILLHKALEEDEEGGGALRGRKEKLRRVNEFLNGMVKEEDKLEIIVSCSRKMETKYWQDLFEAVGEPLELIERLISRSAQASSEQLQQESGAAAAAAVDRGSAPSRRGSRVVRLENLGYKDQWLKLASSFLVVFYQFDRSEGFAHSFSLTMKLLRLSFLAKDVELCKELVRFLGSIDAEGTLMRTALGELGIEL